jgi:hypothetical protein
MELNSHIQLKQLDADLVSGSGKGQLMLAIRRLSVSLSRDGLSTIIAALIPEEPIRSSIVNEPGTSGCKVRLQVTRMGFNARIIVSLSPAPALPGGMLINIDPHNGWSPLDRIMVGIADANLGKIARKQPGVSKIRGGRYQVDLQSLIRDQLLDNSAPVRWDARLEQVEGTPETISVEFVSMVNQT